MISRGFGLKTWLAESYWNGVGALAGIAAVVVALMIGIPALEHRKPEPNRASPSATDSPNTEALADISKIFNPLGETVDPNATNSPNTELLANLFKNPDRLDDRSRRIDEIFNRPDVCCIDTNKAFGTDSDIRSIIGTSSPNAVFALQTVSALVREAHMTGNPSKFLQAVDHVDRALRETDRHTAPDLWARLQGSRGYVLHTMGVLTDDPVSLEEAVKSYRLVLDEWTRSREPLGWAMTLDYMGSALWKLGSMRRDPRSIEQGIAALTAALIVYQDTGRIGPHQRTQAKINLARRTLYALR